MPRELGPNPKKLDNHRPEPWKAPLPELIERLYANRFGRRRPDVVVSIEESARREEHRKAQEPEMKRRRTGEDGQG
jgi:hypothetical protein